MADIDKSFIEPLRANFQKIDTNQDEVISSDELLTARASEILVQQAACIASRHLPGIATEALDKGWVKEGGRRSGIRPTDAEYAGITQRDLTALSRRAEELENAQTLAKYGLSNFEILDKNNDQLIDHEEARESCLNNRFYDIAHVARISNENRVNPYGKTESFREYHHAINRPDLQEYHSKVSNRSEYKNVRAITKSLDHQ